MCFCPLLDLVEEFRAWYCDRFVLMVIGKRVASPNEFEEREDGAVLLNEKGRKIVLEAWMKKVFD